MKTIMGFIALGSTITYLMMDKKKGGKGIDGLEVKINPNKLVDGALAMTNINPMAREGIRQVAHKALNKFYAN